MTLHKKLLIPLVPLLALTAVMASQANDTQAPLRLTVFLHNDIPVEKRHSIHQDYFAHWLEEIKKLTSRRVEITYLEDVRGISDFQYANRPLKDIIKDLSWGVSRYFQEYGGIKGSFKTEKSLLLTYKQIDRTTMGAAVDGGTVGLASMAAYSTAAHELGHMMKATHEQAEVLYRNGWWCETYTFSTRLSLRANCYRYSDLNRQAISAYLSDAP